VDLPDEFDPRDFFLVVKLVQVFEEGIIFTSKAYYSKAFFPFWFGTFLPGYIRLHFDITV
jgi:hypothetical protein